MLPGSRRRRPCRETGRRDQDGNRERCREKIERLSHIHRPGAGALGVWGSETRFAQVLSAHFLDARALTLHHAARRRRGKRSKADPVVHGPGQSFGGTAAQGSRAPHRCVTSLAAPGVAGGRCKGHREKKPQWSSDAPSTNAGFPHSILLPVSTFGVEIWRTGSRVCAPRIGLTLLEILLARKIFVLRPNLSEYLPTGPIPALWAL